MFVKRFLQKAIEPPIPVGRLKASQLSPQLASHHGTPHTASVLAYEPVQRVLAVASCDGRIKLLGAAGIEELLRSPAQLPCKFLEFMNNRGVLVQVNTQNDIEVWDISKRDLVYLQKWGADITSFHIIQGSPFMLVGDHSGLLVVLQYMEEEQLLNLMPYCIPAHITLAGIFRAGSSDTPSVVAILAQPDVFFSRLLVAYGNGLIVLWGLHETQVLAVRGGTGDQRLQLSNYAASLKGRAVAAPSNSMSDEEEKEICCLCWVCPGGSVVAVGYTDGEILLWTLPTIIKAKGQMEMELVDGVPYSGVPLHTVDLAPGKVKMPVVGLSWCSSGKLSRGAGGRLYVFGGGEVGQPEVLKVVSLDSLDQEGNVTKFLQWDINLMGPFADMALLPPAHETLSSPAAALVLLMMPGMLHVYDELSIANYFRALAEGTPSPSSPQPVPLQLPVTETKVTCAKLVLVSNDGMAAKVLLQLPHISTNSVPSTLPAGTKWPISGGLLSMNPSSGHKLEENLYITGHENGLVKVWDASSPSYDLKCIVENQSKFVPAGNHSISTLEFCASSGLLAVGGESGVVFLYKVQNQASESTCYIVSKETANSKEEVLNSGAGFGCILILELHKAAIGTIAIASGVSRLAVGDESGMVSLMDLQSRTILFYDSCFPNHPSGILSVAFSAESVTSDGTTVPLSPSSSSPKSRSNQLPLASITILYVVGKDASMGAIDGTTGGVFGTGAQPKHPSTAISAHLLDCDGTPIKPLSVLPEQQSSDSQASGGGLEALFLLLCCTDSLRLYATSAITQGIRTTIRKVKLGKSCCWSSAFHGLNQESGLILMYDGGDLEFRSLPDLGSLKEVSLSACLSWKIECGVPSLRTISSNINGQLVVIDHDMEIAHISVLEEEASREMVPSNQLYDKDLATAAEAAFAASNAPKKKSQIPGMQGLLGGVVGGVIKELKNVLDPEQVQALHFSSELPKLFSSRPFMVASPQPKSGTGVSSSEELLDIDDIDVDDAPSGPSSESSTGGGFVKKFKWSMKGKEKSDEENRMKLFDGKNEDYTPKARSADDVRAKYGHNRKSATEVSNVMEMARNKLMERGEKLQNIDQRTSELEDNAENFASMAEELAKKMKERKWWEL